MPSILQQQLQQVSTTWGAAANKRQRGRPSVLYTAQEAADVDLESIYEIAQEGALRLCCTNRQEFTLLLRSSYSLTMNVLRLADWTQRSDV